MSSTPISGLPPPEPGGTNVCPVSSPICGVLGGQPELTATRHWQDQSPQSGDDEQNRALHRGRAKSSKNADHGDHRDHRDHGDHRGPWGPQGTSETTGTHHPSPHPTVLLSDFLHVQHCGQRTTFLVSVMPEAHRLWREMDGKSPSHPVLLVYPLWFGEKWPEVHHGPCESQRRPRALGIPMEME